MCVRVCLGRFAGERRETAGVKVRVEVGPKEAQAGTAVVARARAPGEVARKATVNVTAQLVREVKAALDAAGGGGGGDGDEEEDEEQVRRRVHASVFIAARCSSDAGVLLVLRLAGR